jgi:hypothetical protein
VYMDIRVSWTPSISTDVVVQKLEWFVNDEPVRTVLLNPSVSERLASDDGVSLVEGDLVSVVIVVNDGKSDSTPATAEVQVPLVPPQPVTNLVMELIDDAPPAE